LTRQASYSISDNPAGGTSTSLTQSDVLSAGFNRIGGADLPRLFTSQFGAAVAGECTVYEGVIQNPLPNLTYTSLDAGAFVQVSGAAGNRSAARSRSAGPPISFSYSETLSESHSYLQPGRFTLTGPGGADVGSFSGSIDIAPDLVWTNRTSLTTVDRSQPLTFTWSGGEPTTLVTVQGTSTVSQGTAVTVVSFQCHARNTEGRFTVPVSVLSRLPASARITAGTISILIRGTLGVASVGTGARVITTGIDYLTLGNQWGIGQSAEFK
jgi:hypothetical protein